MSDLTTMQPVFIGACPRSGTTFLGDRLGALLNGRVTPESQFKRPVLHALIQHGPDAALKTLESERSYRLWTNRPPRKQLLASQNAAGFFSHLVFRDHTPKDTAPFWIDHTPINLEDFRLLQQVFPNARFVNLVRDGRAVFASVRGLEWGPQNPIHGAWWWAARSAPGLAASLQHPDCCMTVRYEDLANGDLQVWTKLLRFITGDHANNVVEADLHSTSGFDLPDYTRHQHRLVGQAPSGSRVNGWRTTLSPRDIEIFESTNAAALLETLGYDRVHPFPKHASRSEMIRMGEWPLRMTAEPIKKARQALRWRKVGAIRKGADA